MRTPLQYQVFPPQTFILLQQLSPGMDVSLDPVTNTGGQVSDPINRRCERIQGGTRGLEIIEMQIRRDKTDNCRRGE